MVPAHKKVASARKAAHIREEGRTIHSRGGRAAWCLFPYCKGWGSAISQIAMGAGLDCLGCRQRMWLFRPNGADAPKVLECMQVAFPSQSGGFPDAA